MFINKISKVKKRDGAIVDFSRERIIDSINKSSSEINENLNVKLITDLVENKLFNICKGKIPETELIQNMVEEVLINKGYLNVAKAFVLYRQKKKESRAIGEYYGRKSDLKLTLNSLKILQKRYLLKNEKGEVIESPIEMFRRTAKKIAEADRYYGEDSKKTEEEFFEIMKNLEFLPNSPTLMNAGTKVQQLSACFVLPVEDSLNEIFDTLRIAALIQKTGGGTGFNFSKLRRKGGIINSTKGNSSGPVSFMSMFDKMTSIIKLGSRRRGANMGILNVDHPDILEFIRCKERRELTNFNISVSVTDSFMEAVLKNKNYNLIDPKTKRIIKTLNARSVFNLIVEEAWKTGDPGIIFIDEINRKNTLDKKIEATNPCGEQPLLEYESCVLGSINLSKFVKNGKIEWGRLQNVIRISVHFLDNVIDVNNYVDKRIEEITKANRKIGLGIMGWADFLIKLEIPYNSETALKLGDRLMKFISSEADKMSVELAETRGEFKNFNESRLKDKFKKIRNATRTTIAPTGTISIIANEASSGIEPIFAISYVRESLGTKIIETNKLFEDAAKKEGVYTNNLKYELLKEGSIQEIKGMPEKLKKVFVTAFDIKPEWHVKMQSVFQKHTDNAVSKTVNLPREAGKEDIKKIYLLAYKLKCKGITVYRYGSKGKQVLHLDEKVNVDSEFSGGCPGMECGH